MKKIFMIIALYFVCLSTFALIKSREMFILDSIEHIDAVKNLKGLGQIHIGDTYSNVKSILEKYNDISDGTMYFCGDWDTRYKRKMRSDDNCYKISEYIHTNINNANIKEYTAFHYTIGDIYIGRVSCAFYKNKLVAISFWVYDNNIRNEILEHYIKKYGNGCDLFKNGSKSDLCYKNLDRTWSNENVTMKYEGWVGEVLIMSNDGGLEKYIKEYDIYKCMYENEINKKHQSSLDQL